MTSCPQNRGVVGVAGGQESDDSLGVLSALAESCGLTMRRFPAGSREDLAGVLVVGPEPAVTNFPRHLPTLHVNLADSPFADAVLRFGVGPGTPQPFRGRMATSGSAMPALVPDAASEILATADGRPVWTTLRDGEVRRDACWVSRPWIQRGEAVFDHLNRARFMNLLPVLEWLRHLADWPAWTRPPLRACFMFDDPNLHANRYGFVKFDQLATEGRRHRYHTSFATVPLDGYFVSQTAARTIRENSQSLSLLMHGNNHTHRELARRDAHQEMLASMQQSVLRTRRLEQRAGTAISRVMAPPHGVCSAEMMAAMRDAGLEAVCVSHGSARTGNPDAAWTVLLGATPATVVAGLPVIPRFGLERKAENNILLAAYLDQPIIPVGHHWDLADGTDILSTVASFINGLGDVTWADMTAMARSNYRRSIRDHVMRIQVYARVAAVTVPQGVTELEVGIPWLNAEQEHVLIQGGGEGAARPVEVRANGMMRFCVEPGRTLSLAVLPNRGVTEPAGALPGTPLGVIARRVLVEFRDRIMPYLPSIWVRR